MSDDIRTLSEYRAAVEETGQWEATDVDFSNDGVEWAKFLLPTDEHPHPVLARATVIRTGKKDAVQTVLLWDEAIPTDDFANVWLARPHVLFGAAVERAALRRTFPAAVAGIVANDRDQWTAPAADPAVAEVDWTAEIDRTTTVSDVDALHKRMRAHRVVTVDLERTLKAHRKALVAAETAAPDPEPEP